MNASQEVAQLRPKLRELVAKANLRHGKLSEMTRDNNGSHAAGSDRQIEVWYLGTAGVGDLLVTEKLEIGELRLVKGVVRVFVYKNSELDDVMIASVKELVERNLADLS